jgi:hypothetical protein
MLEKLHDEEPASALELLEMNVDEQTVTVVDKQTQLTAR